MEGDRAGKLFNSSQYERKIDLFGANPRSGERGLLVPRIIRRDHVEHGHQVGIRTERPHVQPGSAIVAKGILDPVHATSSRIICRAQSDCHRSGIPALRTQCSGDGNLGLRRSGIQGLTCRNIQRRVERLYLAARAIHIQLKSVNQVGIPAEADARVAARRHPRIQQGFLDPRQALPLQGDIH